MALERDFLAMASTSITVEPLSTHTSYGAPQFSTAAVTYPARVEYGAKLVIGPEGRQVVATATVFVLSTSATISEQDRVTLPRDTAARLLRVDYVDDDEGQHHVELSFG